MHINVFPYWRKSIMYVKNEHIPEASKSGKRNYIHMISCTMYKNHATKTNLMGIGSRSTFNSLGI